MKSACVGVLSIIELKNARWNIEKQNQFIHSCRTLAVYFRKAFIFYCNIFALIQNVSPLLSRGTTAVTECVGGWRLCVR